MRVLEMSHTVRLPANHFWSLRNDSSFERFCAEADGCRFLLLALEHSTDAEGTTFVCKSEVIAETSPLPHALQTLLGAQAFVLNTTSSWWREQHDRAHPCTFETRPRPFGDRVSIQGETWVDDLTRDTCRVNYRVEIKCHVWYQALSTMLETALAKRMHESYAKGDRLPPAHKHRSLPSYSCELIRARAC